MAILLVSPFKETWGLKGLALWPRPALTLGVCHPGWEMGMGPRWDTGAKQGPASPLLVSWGVASTTCHPSKPDGKSGLFIQQSFHTWKFLDGHGRWAGSEQPAQGLPSVPSKSRSWSPSLGRNGQPRPSPSLTKQNRGSGAPGASCSHQSRCPW